MPEITNDNIKQKEKKVSATKKSTKVASKNTAKKTTQTSSKKGNTSKKVASTKASTTSKKSTNSKANTKNKVEKNIENKKEKIIKEETVIEKIKSFLAKIAAMQEEAKQTEESEAEAIGVKKEVKTKKNTNTPYMLEYYDLPYRYNETVVKILAQTPKKLFVYWDISDNDRQKYVKAFGEKFFEETYPVLLVHNEEKDYTFEVAINDFANSWYLDIKDPKSKYVIELGRKFKQKPEVVNIATTDETKDVVLHNDYVPITSSNILEVPNDHILFEKVEVRALYRNVKDNTETFVDINNNKFTRGMGHIYNIYDVYKEIYKNEIEDESLFDLLNPSSMSSSKFK